MRRERGQERTGKRTVGREEKSGKTLAKRGGAFEKKGDKKSSAPLNNKGIIKKTLKKESLKENRDSVPRERKVLRTGLKISAPKDKEHSGFREKTSDTFRRNVLKSPVKKAFDRVESDQYLNKGGKVLRGRFGKQNVYNELFSSAGTRDKKPEKTRETIRLNRYIANAGLCSRREADTFISTGCVKVNGKIVSEMGFQVNPGDQVSFNGKIITSEKKVYLLLNKPKGFVTTLDDPHAENTVMDLIKNACAERIYPVGRLDKNTTGLLLFTNDGELTKRLTHPKYNRKKIYHVFLDQKVTKEHLKQIVEGVNLEDGFVAADSVSYVSDEDKKQVGIEIHSGKNKIVRRIFEHLGYRIIKLDRVYFCGLTKKNLPRGKWRFLNQDEVNLLKMSSR